ncbi:MAG: hypothetical protein PHN72_03880 [Bacilli bacterium]|nr:hypothetical protein [Bacilli bacterium]
MKFFLFFYPLSKGTYLERASTNEKRLLEETIQRRYRNKGYQICWLESKGLPWNQKLHENSETDMRIESSMHYNWNYTRFGNEDYRNKLSREGHVYIDYPCFEDIKNSLIQIYKDIQKKEKEHPVYSSEKIQLVISGIDGIGTINKFSAYFANDSTFDVCIDSGLTPRFFRDCARYSFQKNISIYNPANLQIYDQADRIFDLGKSFCEKNVLSSIKSCFCKSTTCLPTISLLEAYLERVFINGCQLPGKREELLEMFKEMLSGMPEPDQITALSSYVQTVFQNIEKELYTDSFPQYKQKILK